MSKEMDPQDYSSSGYHAAPKTAYCYAEMPQPARICVLEVLAVQKNRTLRSTARTQARSKPMSWMEEPCQLAVCHPLR